MRILITSQPGAGHIGPLIPIAKAFISTGHQVVIASGASYRNFVEKEGLGFIAAGLDFDEGRPAETLPEMLDVPDEKKARWLLDTIFMDKAPKAMLPILLDIVDQFDLVIHDNYEYAGALAAEKMGVPYICCNMSFLMRRDGVKVAIGKSLNMLRKHVGLPTDKGCEAIGRHMDMRLMPISFSFMNALTGLSYKKLLVKNILKGRQISQSIKMLIISSILSWVKYRHHENLHSPQPNEIFINVWRQNNEPTSIPDWLRLMPKNRKTIYVSLGTVFNTIYPEVYDKVFSAAKNMNVNLIMVLGKEADLTRYGPLPSNVYVKDYVDQELLMPFVDLCIIHGGFSTTMKGLNSGIPQLILPLSGDQPAIYSIANTLGAAVDLPFDILKMDAEGAFGIDVKALTAGHLKDLINEGLGNPKLKACASNIKEAMDHMDGEAEAVARIVRKFSGDITEEALAA